MYTIFLISHDRDKVEPSVVDYVYFNIIIILKN